MGYSDTLEGHGHWWQKRLRKACQSILEETGTCCCNGAKWKHLVKKLKNEGRSICHTKPSRFQFQYDPLSYAQNFDEGCWQDSEYPYKGFSARFVVTPIAKPREKK
eukprot:Gb_16948 [translate_table: standard]